MGSVGLWVRVCLLEALAADPVHEHDRARAEVKNVTCATPPIHSLLMVDGSDMGMQPGCNSVKQSLETEKDQRGRGEGSPESHPSREP